MPIEVVRVQIEAVKKQKLCDCYRTRENVEKS